MEDLDELIGILNRPGKSHSTQNAVQIFSQEQPVGQKENNKDQKLPSERKLNLEKIVERLDAMEVKKHELLELNAQLKLKQEIAGAG